MQEPLTLSPHDESENLNGWWRVLRAGIGLYLVGLIVLVLTQNPNIFPTVVLVGSFMVPVTYVAFFYERRHLSHLTLPNTAMGFFWGGVLGIFAAALLEPLFIQGLTISAFFTIGFIEEFVKIFGVLVIARKLRHDSELNGLILGAAAGMGFAALESTGYAFSAFMRSGGSLSAMVGVTLLRGILSPIGHGTWTAILAGVLFRESIPGRFIINSRVVMAYLTVVFLHAMWDLLPSLITAMLLPGLDIIIGQTLIGGIGLFILWRRWKEARRLQIERMLAEMKSREISESE
ncbi:MAG: PrsW family glutamic-type intramembrane protease [Calditrichia bacterium]